MSSPKSSDTSVSSNTKPKRAPRKKMTNEEKHNRSLQRTIDHGEKLIAWGCFDEIIPGNSFLKCLCRLYENWAYEQISANTDKNALFPTPREWVANKEAMLKLKKEQFHHSHTIQNELIHDIEVGFIGYIKCLDDPTIIKKAKSAILEWKKIDYSYEPSLVTKEAEKYWNILQRSHNLGSQIVRELRENKETLISILSNEENKI